MPVFAIPALIGVAFGWITGHSSNVAPAPDPINSVTNLVIVGSLAFIGYKVFVKHG